MTTFQIVAAKDLLAKLKEDQIDFAVSHSISSRHALNAIYTAYHLHEWVWGECYKNHHDLIARWGLEVQEEPVIFRKFVSEQCAALKDARKIINGTKHFGLDRISTGKHRGSFQIGASQGFDVSYLWIDRGGIRQRADEFIKELVDFWDSFFSTYRL